MEKKADFLEVCNEHKVLPEDFRLTFCSRCAQPECLRSMYGKSTFEQRHSTWYERLFDKVPRMPSDDPRFPVLSGARFLEVPGINKGTSVQVPSSWGDPLSQSEGKKESNPLEETSRQPPPPGVDSSGDAGRSPIGKNKEVRVQGLNTPPQPAMLPGAPNQPSKVLTVDPWAASIPADHDPNAGKVVRRGATIRFGNGNS